MNMYGQKMRLLSLNLALLMIVMLVPVQAADIVIGDDGPLYTVVLNGNGGTCGENGDETLNISCGYDRVSFEDYRFVRAGYTLLGWSENDDASTIDYTCFDSIWGGNIGDEMLNLYAVWGEGETCALYTDAVPNAAYTQVGQYYVVNSEILPAVNDNGFIGWYDHLRGFYANGAVKAGETYSSVYSYRNPVILNGNGGKSNFGGDIFFGGAEGCPYFDTVPRSGERCFSKEGYILDGWTASPDSDTIIAAGGKMLGDYASNGNGAMTIYAHWSPAYQLIDGTRLVIDGDEMNQLLENDSGSMGDGWQFHYRTSPYFCTGEMSLRNFGNNSEPYSFGNMASDKNFVCDFSGNVVTGQIEVNGDLSIYTFGSDYVMQVKTIDIPAIHAGSVSLNFTNADYQASYLISAENAIGIDSSYIYLGSSNITVTGKPAVREDAKIVCGDGISYTTVDNGDGMTTLTTSAVERNITLNGNGGMFNDKETVDADYDVSNKLDLSRYAFTREGFALIGWSADANGSNFVTRYDGKISSEPYTVLYAVWLAVPKDTGYAIFEFWGRNGERMIPDAFSSNISSMTYCCMKITDDFIMPETISDNDRYPVVWQSVSDYSLYASGEHTTLTSGTIFKSAVSIYEKDTHIIMLDGNGGTYMTGLGNVEYCASRSVETGSYLVGATVNYARSFTRPGYELVSYNSEPDGSGTEYALNKCTVTADMAPIQILYAQWKKIEESGQYITIDGKQYDATRDWSGDGWDYFGDIGQLSLNGYKGTSIESDVKLRVHCVKKASAVLGNISAPQLDVFIHSNGEGNGASLTVYAQKGAGLCSKESMQINVQENTTMSVTGIDESPAISVGGELNLCVWGEGKFSARSSNVAAISAVSINAVDEYDCLITAGTSPEDAVEVDRYTDQQYVSYERRTKTLTLHGSGGTAGGKDSIFVATKEGGIDLSQYANSFSNGGKMLLGWSRNADAIGVDYQNSSNAEFNFSNNATAADLYAVWDSDEQKGIVLNDYGYYGPNAWNGDDQYYYVESITQAHTTGSTYTLPSSYKAGYFFNGWRSALDNTLYSAGTEITVDQSQIYTAEYEVLSLTIDGTSYRMDESHGSYSLGWRYEPASKYGYWADQIQLYIYESYSGKPVSIPSNAWLSLDGNITGENGQPAIYVDGNADISVVNGKTSTIRGCVNSPAVKVTGTLSIDNLLYGPHYSWQTVIAFEGGDKQPAINAREVQVRSPLYAGNSAAEVQLVGTYGNEHYIRIEAPITVAIESRGKLPEFPNTDSAQFVAWGIGGDNYRWSEYALPGDTNDSERTKIYEAVYIRSSEGALILNGNGGTTNDGQKYYITTTSGSNLKLTRDTTATAFHRDNYTLQSYSTNADGSGAKYSAEELASQLNGDNTVTGRVVTFFAQWTRTGDPDTPTPDEPITTLDGSASYTVSGGTATIDEVDTDKLIAESDGKKSAELDLSNAGENVTEVLLPTDAVKTVAGSGAEEMTVKLPGVSVSFDEKALSAVAAQSEGERVSLDVSIGDRNSLNTAQANAVAKAKELSVIEVSLSSGNRKISDFNGGSVTINIPFQWSMRGLLCAYYVDENGSKTAIDVTYKDGVATLVLKHFSTYVVEIDELQEPFVNVMPDSITVSVGDTVKTCVAAIYDEDGKLIELKTAKVGGDSNTVTISCQTELLTGKRMLKVFFLDEEGSPCREAAMLETAK